jgi:hypothetical protein
MRRGPTGSTGVPEAQARPGPHPEPPATLARRRLPLRVLPVGARLYRLHPLAYEATPLHFGRGRENRFAAPAEEYGVLYAGDSPHCAFVETFGRDLGSRLVTEATLGAYCLTEVRVTSELRLVDLTGARLRRLGADARLTHGDYGLSRRWSHALWSHPVAPDGLCWYSRLDDDRLAFGLFDRARDSVEPACHGSLLLPAHRPLLGEILDTYAFGLL